MTIRLRKQHLLATLVLSSVIGAIRSSPVTTTPNPATVPSTLSSVSPPQSSSSSSSSSFIATSSHTSTSVLSSSSSSSAEKGTSSQNASSILDVASVPSSDIAGGAALPESKANSTPLPLPSEDASLSKSLQADEASLSTEPTSLNHLSSTVQTEPSVTSTLHSPSQTEITQASPAPESSTDGSTTATSPSAFPSSEAPPSLSDAEPSLFNESSLSPAESRSLFSEAVLREEPELLSPLTLQSLPSEPENATGTELNQTETAHSSNLSVEALYNLTREFFQWRLQESPQYATEAGDNANNTDRFDDVSPEHFERRKIKTEEFLERAQGINASELSGADLLTHRIFIEDMSSFLRNYKYLKFFMPVTIIGGPQQSLKYTLKKSTVLNSFDDYKKLISRFRDFPRQADQLIDIMRGNIADGLMPSNWSLGSVTEQFDDLLVPFNESVFYEPFVNIHISMTPEEKELLRQEAEPAVEALLAAFRKMSDFIQDEYMLAARPEVGVSSLPDGAEYYQACLQFHTSTDMTPQQIHDLGLSEVARIHEEVKQTAVDLGMANKTLSEISAIVKTDPGQRFTSKEDLLETYRSAVYNNIYPLMDKVIDGIPAINVSVEENVAGDGYASYADPPPDGSRPGTFFINADIYRHHRKYEVNALSLHETVPGHHLQAILLLKNPSLPEYRRSPDYFSYPYDPMRYPLHTAFSEGWGLYSEFLGDELGLYQDPHQRLGRHSFEMLRAGRLVVDTGLHALGWSRQEAVDYLLQNTAMSRKAVENQIDRYISWPGQATSYKVGEIKIRMLREKAEKELGEYFRVQDFHATVLGCCGPLNILEECVDSYIQKTIVKNTNDESILV
ncbi:uncharacterized protein LOC135203217 [Macrobrachium nipponense]|uniref:uncharacterized protein LOC135203217 n=1 Tax=Macrobrachium nipponense TaxID=159736 RepID=UPI0030C85A09